MWKSLPDTLYPKSGGRRELLMRDPRKGEDMRSLMRKLERMVDQGWCTARRQGDGGWFTITDAGREALTGERGRHALDVMVKRHADRVETARLSRS